MKLRLGTLLCGVGLRPSEEEIAAMISSVDHDNDQVWDNFARLTARLAKSRVWFNNFTIYQGHHLGVPFYHQGAPYWLQLLSGRKLCGNVIRDERKVTQYGLSSTLSSSFS